MPIGRTRSSSFRRTATIRHSGNGKTSAAQSPQRRRSLGDANTVGPNVKFSSADEMVDQQRVGDVHSEDDGQQHLRRRHTLSLIHI